MADTNPSALPSSAKAEFPCPDCGEMVREGLVRCWNCGGFLRPEMEQKFQKMQEKGPQLILSTTVEPDAVGADIDNLMSEHVSGGEGDEDDFQISPQIKKTKSPTTSGTTTDKPAEDTTPPDGQPQPAGADEKSGQSGQAATGDDGIHHSVATGGDALLELATAEDKEREQKQSSRPTTIEGVKAIRDGYLIDAPKGCRIQVRDERTGEMRRLTFGASSRVRISLLDKLQAIAKEKKEAASKEPEGPKHLSAGKYQRWMSGVHLHVINPAKLKLVADSLTKEFVPVELGFAEDEMLVVSLPVAKKSLFGGGKAPEGDDAREALLKHLRADKSLEGEKVEVVGDVKDQFSADKVAEIRVVQPALSLSDSLFAGIPVFGEGRIAVQIPVQEAGNQPKVLSFTLTQFRTFVEIIGPLYSMADFGHNLGIPLKDEFEEHKCHFSDVKIRVLQHVEFYEADPEFETIVAGYKCEECGIAVSEDARKKEKLGGKGGKAMAKAKCPKCEKKMGYVPLMTLASIDSGPSMQEGEQEEDVTDAAPPEGATEQATEDAAGREAAKKSE